MHLEESNLNRLIRSQVLYPIELKGALYHDNQYNKNT